ncbi:MAG: isocitrate/isopropylmalate dehydrogenase family protein [Thermoplasmata archaeon]
MTKYKLVVLPGDGIGKEVIWEAVKVLEAIEEIFPVDFERITYPCGGEYFLETGKEWPEEAFEVCKKEADAVLLGAIGYPEAILPNGDLAGTNVVFGLRFGLDLYANVRPTKLYPNVKHKISNEFRNIWKPGRVDFVTVRENTEGCYTPTRGYLERGGSQELAVDSRVITRKGSERVIKFAFELCMRRKGAPYDGKRRVTCVDKSNVMSGCRLFRRIYNEVAERYPDVNKDYAYIDAFTQWLIRNPEWYDVAVCPNMFGDIATDLASVLEGGMGMAAGGNIGDEHAMFEPIHGSAPRHAGKDKVNPIAAISATRMMLDWVGLKNNDHNLMVAAERLEQAIIDVLKEGKYLTYDLGGSSKCSEVGSAIAERIKEER